MLVWWLLLGGVAFVLIPLVLARWLAYTGSEAFAAYEERQTGEAMPIIGMDEVFRQLHQATSDVLRPDDHEALRGIEAACARETGELADLVMAYYRDADRAARTPHAFLQLHIGMLAGRLQRRAADR